MTAPSPHGTPATLHYGDGEFLVLKSGSHVRCAVTQHPIPLPLLRYWSSQRQEAYLGPLEYLKAQADNRDTETNALAESE